MSATQHEPIVNRRDRGELPSLTAPVKSFPVVQLKALGEKDGVGQFEAIVAVFDNIDAYGDRILAGAFERTLKPPPEGRGYPPIVWSHMWFEPPIGASAEAEEVTDFKLANGDTISGLRILGDLFIGENDRAREVYAAMKNVGGDGLSPLREFSFAYFVRSGRFVDEPVDEDDSSKGTREVYELLELDVIEVGPTLLGANPATQLVDVRTGLPTSGLDDDLGKALTRAHRAIAEVKAGAVLSAANRGRIESAIEALGAVLEDADKEKETDTSKSTDKPEERRREVAELLATF